MWYSFFSLENLAKILMNKEEVCVVLNNLLGKFSNISSQKQFLFQSKRVIGLCVIALSFAAGI